MKPGHAHVIDALDRRAQAFGCDGGLFRDRKIRGAGAKHGNFSGARRQRVDIAGQNARLRAVDRVRQLRANGSGLLRRHARGKGILSGVIQRAHDRDDLRRGLARAVDHLRHTAALLAGVVGFREMQVIGHAASIIRSAPRRVWP